MSLNIIIVTLAAVCVDSMPQFVLQQPVYQVQYVPTGRIQQNNLNYRNINPNVQNVVVYEIESYNQAFQSEIASDRRGAVTTVNRDGVGANAELKVYERSRQSGSAVSDAETNRKSFDAIPDNVQQSYSEQNSEVGNNNMQYNGFMNTDLSTISKPYRDNTRNNYYDDDISRNTRVAEDPNRRSDISVRESAGSTKGNVYLQNNLAKFDNSVTPNSINSRAHSVNIDKSNRKAVPQNKNPYDNQITINTNTFYDNHRNISENESNENRPRTDNRQTARENYESVLRGNASGLNENFDNKNNTSVADVFAFNGETSNSTDGVQDSMQAPGSRSGLDAPGNMDEDRWVWNVTEKVITTTPLVEKRVSFDGGTCPSGKIKVGGKCVDVDT